IVFTIICLSLMIPNISISQANAAQTDQCEKAKERGELRVGLSADYAPYEFEHTKDGNREYAGIDIELAKKIAKDNDIELKIVNMQFDSLLGALKTGKIDMIISGMAPTPERKKEVDFSDYYMEVKQRMIVQNKDKDKLKTVDDFKGKMIGVQKQTTQEELAKTEMPESQLSSLTRVPEVIMSLNSGKIDGMIIEGPVADAYLEKNPNLTYSDVEFSDADKITAIALPKNSPELMDRVNKSVKDVRDNNLIKDYQDKATEAMFDDGSFFSKYGSYFLHGIGITILLSFLGVVAGAIIGCVLALMKLGNSKILKSIASVYIEFIRGTPLLVQVFLLYFGTTAVLGLDLSALICGIIALIINCSAYIAEIIRAGINAVDNGQMEAARSLGLNRTQAM